MSGHSSAGRSHCQNCGSPLSGPYCSSCGQHDIDYHRSLGPIIEDSLEGFLHFDGKFFRSVRWLFTRPGFLTREFVAGRRVAYIHPLRLYIFASFLFFAGSLLLQQPLLSFERSRDQGKVDLVAKDLAAGDSGILGLISRFRSENQDEVGKELNHLYPTALFFCLPFLAAALLLAYRNSGRVYVEHLIFALHVQAFYFMANLATILVQTVVRVVSVPLADLLGTVAFVVGACLIYRALRSFYGEGAWRTFMKMCLVGFLYGFVLIAAITLTAVTSNLLLLSSPAGNVPAVH
jgi:hypothetical protein